MKPERAIRRSDAFAEYREQDEAAEGRPKSEPKGFGCWVAKIVATRKFGGAKPRGRRDTTCLPP